MTEVTLSTGKVVSIDMSKVTFGESRNFFSSKFTPSQDDAFVEKVTGLKPAEQEATLRDDYRRIIQGIIRAGNEPLADPNLPSVSTSD